VTYHQAMIGKYVCKEQLRPAPALSLKFLLGEAIVHKQAEAVDTLLFFGMI
jgi:hypothetical protein